MKRRRQARPSAAHEPQGHLDGPEFLRQSDICRWLGISDETWRRWRQAGRVPRPVDLPGAPRWSRRDLEAWLLAKRQPVYRVA